MTFGWPCVRSLSSISWSLAAITFGSSLATPSIFKGLSLLPSLLYCIRLSMAALSFLTRAIMSSLLARFARKVSSLMRDSPLPRWKALRSPSMPAIRFSNRALSSRSVFPESTATYSEKGMPPFSSMPPSSMVRQPMLFCLSWVMKSCLL